MKRPMKYVSFYLDEYSLRAIDRAAAELSTTRSTVLRLIIRQWIAGGRRIALDRRRGEMKK